MKKAIKKNPKLKQYFFYSIILIIFIALTTLIASKHELWSDEAQGWLLAQDVSFKELFRINCRLEGHPILYYAIIKLFQLFGLKYSGFKIISLLFSFIGIAIFLFKSSIKWQLKALFPFTYFIFYQYAIIARSYCLILPLISILAIIWEKRKEHYLLFTIILILMINLESYTMLLAGSIYLLELIDFFKNKKKDKKRIIYFVILFLSFLLTTIYMFPVSARNVLVRTIIGASFSGAFFMPFGKTTLLKILTPIVSTALLLYLFIIYKKYQTKKELMEAIIMFLPIFLFSSVIYANIWHEGIYFLLIIFLTWIHKLDHIKSFKILLIFSFIVQIFWSYKSSINDYKNKYSSAYEASELIKQYDYDNLKIYATNSRNVEIQPYFDHNIYYNWYPDERYFYWNTENAINHTSIKPEDIIKDNVDIYISYYSIRNDEEKEKEELKDNYNLYSFKAAEYYKDRIVGNMNINIFVKKELDK